MLGGYALCWQILDQWCSSFLEEQQRESFFWITGSLEYLRQANDYHFGMELGLCNKRDKL